MDKIWSAPEYGDETSGAINCVANVGEVNVTKVEGPSSCERNSFIKLNLTLSLRFNADRYDLGAYTFTGTPDELDSFADPLDAAILGDECAFAYLTQPYNDTENPSNGIKNLEGPGGDVCLDVKGQSGITFPLQLRENLEVPCIDQDGSAKLVVQTCFTWHSNVDYNNCTRDDGLPVHVWPSPSSQCDCDFIEVDIDVEVCDIFSFCKCISLFSVFIYSHCPRTH